MCRIRRASLKASQSLKDAGNILYLLQRDSKTAFGHAYYFERNKYTLYISASKLLINNTVYYHLELKFVCYSLHFACGIPTLRSVSIWSHHAVHWTPHNVISTQMQYLHEARGILVASLFQHCVSCSVNV